VSASTFGQNFTSWVSGPAVLITPDEPNEPAPSPIISVVVSARNEETLIEECLAAVCRQEIPEPYEVIVVDNGSSDLTTLIASKFRCKIITEPRPGQLIAKRAGVDAARGSIVAILDADCIPNVTWLANIYAAMNVIEHKPTAVTCCYRYIDLPWWGYAFVSITRLIFVSGSRLMFGTLRFVIGGNVAFLREALVRMGGYPTSGGIAETELGLAEKLRSQGTIRYLPSMMVWSSARRFKRGIGSFLIDYKLKEYALPYLRRTSCIMSRQARKRL
jgi:glycosyltransferase involved in cell wall biosynthesis